MATVELTQDNFESTIDDHSIVVIDFWADWCGPCLFFGPIYEEVSQEHPDVVFAKVDTQKEPLLAAALHIRSIPNLMVFREKVLLYNQPGLMPGPALRELVDRVKDLDMNEVRAKIAEIEAAAEPETKGNGSSWS